MNNGFSRIFFNAEEKNIQIDDDHDDDDDWGVVMMTMTRMTITMTMLTMTMMMTMMIRGQELERKNILVGKNERSTSGWSVDAAP